jgi:hypothetical protein
VGASLLRRALEDARNNWTRARGEQIVNAWNRINLATRCLTGSSVLIDFAGSDLTDGVGEAYRWRIHRLGEALDAILFDEDRSPWYDQYQVQMTSCSAPNSCLSIQQPDGTFRSVPKAERTFLNVDGELRPV